MMAATVFDAGSGAGLRWQALQRQLATGFQEAPFASREPLREPQLAASSWLGRARLRAALASARA